MDKKLEILLAIKNKDAYDEYSLCRQLVSIRDCLAECRDELKGITIYNQVGLYDEELTSGFSDVTSLLAKVVIKVDSLADIANELELEME